MSGRAGREALARRSRRSELSEPGGRMPAPGDLRIVQRFINSLDREGRTDEFDSPLSLSDWLDAEGLT